MGDRSKRLVSIIIALLIASSSAGCSELARFTKAGDKDVEAELVNSGLVEVDARLGFKLFRELLAMDPDKNLVISPTSAAMALDMLYNGADTRTKEAIGWVLEIQGLDIRNINRANSSLLQLMQNADSRVDLSIANSLWISDEEEVIPSFSELVSAYKARLNSVDFNAPPPVAEQINGWIGLETNGKIGKVFERVEPQSFFLLVSAASFEGVWQTGFDPKATELKPFNLAGGGKKSVPMMKQSGTYRYLRKEEFQVVAVPYGDGRLNMYLFLPYSDLKEFYATLTPENWKSWMKEFFEVDGTIEIPRFSIESNLRLNAALRGIGMGIAFEPDADFSLMVERGGLWIDEARHAAKVSVGEEGISYGATTPPAGSGEMRSTPFTMVVDRPFFFTIRDEKTGAILFMGSVVDPQ